MLRNACVVVLVVLFSGCGYFAKPAATASKDAEARVFNSNFDTWLNHPPMEDEAQLSLLPEREKVIQRLVGENFTSHDRAVLARIGRKIWDIGGEAAIPIVLEFVKDPRVVVAENAKLWYKHYSPKAILDKIEKNSKDISTEKYERVGLDGRLKAEQTARKTAEDEFNRRLKIAEDAQSAALRAAEAAKASEEACRSMKESAESRLRDASELAAKAAGAVATAQQIAGNCGVLSTAAERARAEASQTLAAAERASAESKELERRAAEAEANAVKLSLLATTAANTAAMERQNAEKWAEKAREANQPAMVFCPPESCGGSRRGCR